MRSTERWLRFATLVLVLVGTLYLGKGAYGFARGALDFRQRWQEQQYVLRGKDPVAIWERSLLEKHGVEVSAAPVNAQIEPDLGVTEGGYPPWSYLSGLLFAAPGSFRVAQVWFGLVNLGLFASVLSFAYALGRRRSRDAASFFGASVFAVSSFCTTFGLGQYGVVGLAAVLFGSILDRRERWLSAGLLLGIALAKPTLAGPFLILPLLRGRWRTLGVSGAVVVIGSLFTWSLTGTDPLSMFASMSRAVEYYVGGGYSLLNGFLTLGLSTRTSMHVATLVTLAVGLPLLWLWRRAEDDLVLLAVAGTVARLWTYHNHNDNLLLVFLLLAFAVRLHERRAALFGFGLVALTLWPPARVCDVTAFRAFQLAAWSGATALLLSITPRAPARLAPALESRSHSAT